MTNTNYYNPTSKNNDFWSLAADEIDADFSHDATSDTVSVTSSIFAGHVENGRRYQTLREGEYWGPSDDKQFESMEYVHAVHVVLDSEEANPLFQSPIPETARNILDIGTGNGLWAKEVADRWPDAEVHGIDLFPPPSTWVPPNCRLEVDDALKPWLYKEPFDLVHIRWLMGAFTGNQWRLLYKQAYNNLLPGGWIEQIEPDITHYCDDGTLPPDSNLANWGPIFLRAGAKSGRDIDTVDTFPARIAAAGFTNLHCKEYKVPVGEWAKHPILKEAGKFNKKQLLTALEGCKCRPCKLFSPCTDISLDALYLLTKWGDPDPWSPEEVQILLTKVRKELDNGYHIYFVFRRVYAQKPFHAERNGNNSRGGSQNVI